MITLDTLRGEKRAEILRLAELHGARNVRVFGSVARGDNDEKSDVDFLVQMDQGRSLFDLVELKLALDDLLGIEADVVSEDGLKYIKERVLKEAKPL